MGSRSTLGGGWWRSVEVGGGYGGCPGDHLHQPPEPPPTLSVLLNLHSLRTLALPMPTTALVALTTLASEADARALVTALLGDHLIACGTLLPGGRSLYRWQGKVTEEAEVVVLLKTDGSKWDALCAAVRDRHPYEVPELLALPVERGLDRYLAWLTQEVVGDPQA